MENNSEMKSLTKNVLPEITIEELEPRLEMAILTVVKDPRSFGHSQLCDEGGVLCFACGIFP